MVLTDPLVAGVVPKRVAVPVERLGALLSLDVGGRDELGRARPSGRAAGARAGRDPAAGARFVGVELRRWSARSVSPTSHGVRRRPGPAVGAARSAGRRPRSPARRRSTWRCAVRGSVFAPVGVRPPRRVPAGFAGARRRPCRPASRRRACFKPPMSTATDGEDADAARRRRAPAPAGTSSPGRSPGDGGAAARPSASSPASAPSRCSSAGSPPSHLRHVHPRPRHRDVAARLPSRRARTPPALA